MIFSYYYYYYYYFYGICLSIFPKIVYWKIKIKKYGRKLTFSPKSTISSIGVLTCPSSLFSYAQSWMDRHLRFWKSMSVGEEKRHLIPSFLSSLHIIYLSLGSLCNFKVSNFGRISTFSSSPWRSNVYSRTLQLWTFIFFKLLNLCIK